LRQSQTGHANKLTFSLDDIVLTAANLVPVARQPGDRLTLFHHKFGAEAQNPIDANASLGIFDPDAGNHLPFYSYRAATLNGRAHLHLWDYADWTRLVILNGNMYDAFSERTPDRDGHTAIGARAAVNWLDAIGAVVPAGESMDRRPGPADSPTSRSSRFSSSATQPGVPSMPALPLRMTGSDASTWCCCAVATAKAVERTRRKS